MHITRSNLDQPIVLDKYCITGQVPMNNWCITAVEIAARKIVAMQDCRKWMRSEFNITTVSYDFLVVCLIINYLYIILTKWVLDNEVPREMDLYLKADKICRNHLFHTYNETIWKQKFTVSDLKKEIFYHVNQCYLFIGCTTYSPSWNIIFQSKCSQNQ